MSEYPVLAPRGFSGSATAAILVGVMSLAAIPVLAWAVLPLGGTAVVLGLISRRALRADPSLRGARLSLAGFILGSIGMLLGGAVPLLLMLLWRLFGSGD